MAFSRGVLTNNRNKYRQENGIMDSMVDYNGEQYKYICVCITGRVFHFNGPCMNLT